MFEGFGGFLPCFYKALGIALLVAARSPEPSPFVSEAARVETLDPGRPQLFLRFIKSATQAKAGCDPLDRLRIIFAFPGTQYRGNGKRLAELFDPRFEILCRVILYFRGVPLVVKPPPAKLFEFPIVASGQFQRCQGLVRLHKIAFAQ